MRYSKQREEIYKIIRNTDIHPNADWIFKHVKENSKDKFGNSL